jgi:hypothetical protein
MNRDKGLCRYSGATQSGLNCRSARSRSDINLMDGCDSGSRLHCAVAAADGRSARRHDQMAAKDGIRKSLMPSVWREEALFGIDFETMLVQFI